MNNDFIVIQQGAETRDDLLERATRQRVELAHMRADMIKMELYRDKVDGLEEQNRLLKKENTRLASTVGRLNEKIEKLTGKVENKAADGAEQDSEAAQSDDRGNDTAGSSGRGVPD